MSHQVLARKWRPREFGSLVGQEHVVRALTHALETGRLHHAYLFTGTRGVGKTTIARILAKSVNCETGVTSKPCGSCGACTAIDQGRFPDYLELDAASNRGVEEMAQLLENAVYAPVSGRYKVYVIDEVHMLTAHAFNAMLKTLEEPPGHVVFILATTDPQKVPVTVLSRCLQFSLKNVPAPAVAAHLGRVLEAEAVEFEPGALAQIGRAAAGSMRDALSLLDQAIAYGGGRVDEGPVREMLGIVDRRDLERILDALVVADGPALVAVADDMLAGNAPFERVLLDLAALLQRIALHQVGVAVGDGDDRALLDRLAQSIAAEELQVYYQVAVHGARELPLAPDPHAGFTMTLLRLLAFRPDAGNPPRAAGAAAPISAGAAAPRGSAAASARAASAASAAPAPPAAAAQAAASPAPAAAAASRRASGSARAPASESPPTGDPAPAPAARTAEPGATEVGSGIGFDGDWAALAATLPQGGMIGQFIQQSELIRHDAGHFTLRVPIRQLAEPGIVGRVRDLLSQQLGASIRLSVEVGAVQGATAAAASSQQQAERQARAQQTIEGDAFVRTLLTEFDGTIIPESVRPIEPTGEPK